MDEIVFTVVAPAEVQPGDTARHIDGALDSRMVSRVGVEGVWLQLLGREAGPFPTENYTFSRATIG